MRTAVLYVCFSISVAFGVAQAEEPIDDRPLNANEVLKQVSIVGYRQFPKDAFTLVDPKTNQWAMDASILYEAAAGDPDLQKMFGAAPDKIKLLPLKDLTALYKKTAVIKDPNCAVSADKKCSARTIGGINVISLSDSAWLNGKMVDSDFVHRAVATGFVNTSNVIPIRAHTPANSPSFGVGVDPHFALATMQLYNAIEESGPEDKPGRVFKIGNIAKFAAYNSKYASISTVNFGEIKIGTPFIFSAKEKKLIVEPSISKRFDVYWILFAINPQTDLRGTIDHISFFVSLKTKNSLALELAPIRFGQDVTKKEELGTPEIKVQTPGGGVSVGKIYGQEISYKTLKPTIIGTGLQDTEFGWSMMDDMVDMSAKRFVAVVGVPKGTAKIEFEMILRARPAARFGGLLQKDFASSVPVSFSRELPRQ